MSLLQYWDYLPQNLAIATSQKCKHSTSGWLASLRNVFALSSLILLECVLCGAFSGEVTTMTSAPHVLFYIKHIATRWVRRINLNFNYFSGTGCCCHFGGFSWNNITLCRHLFRSRCWEGWYSLSLLVTFPHKCSWSKNSPARPNPSPQSIGVLSSPVFRGKTGKLIVVVMFLITSRLSPLIVSFKVQPDLQC